VVGSARELSPQRLRRGGWISEIDLASTINIILTTVIAAATGMQVWVSYRLWSLETAIEKTRTRVEIRPAFYQGKSDEPPAQLCVANLSSFGIWLDDVNLSIKITKLNGNATDKHSDFTISVHKVIPAYSQVEVAGVDGAIREVTGFPGPPFECQLSAAVNYRTGGEDWNSSVARAFFTSPGGREFMFKYK